MLCAALPVGATSNVVRSFVCCPGLWLNNLLSPWYMPLRTYDLPVPAPPCRQTNVCECSLCICCCTHLFYHFQSLYDAFHNDVIITN